MYSNNLESEIKQMFGVKGISIMEVGKSLFMMDNVNLLKYRKNRDEKSEKRQFIKRGDKP